jgi:hypothetical protein
VGFQNNQILETLLHKKQRYLTSKKQVQKNPRGETPENSVSLIDILYTLDSASLLVKLKPRIFQRLPPFE